MENKYADETNAIREQVERQKELNTQAAKEGQGVCKPELVDALQSIAKMKNNSGVIKNPPPTPNMPERMPTSPPNPKRRKALTDTSAMGR